MLEVARFDSSDPLSVVLHLRPRLDQSVEHNVAVKVDDGDTSQSITLLGEDPFAVEGQDFCLSSTRNDLISNRFSSLTFLASVPS